MSAIFIQKQLLVDEISEFFGLQNKRWLDVGPSVQYRKQMAPYIKGVARIAHPYMGRVALIPDRLWFSKCDVLFPFVRDVISEFVRHLLHQGT